MNSIEKVNEKSKGLLPEDFIKFLSKNYKTINYIDQKVAQFENDPWSNFYKKLGCRNWRNMRLSSTKQDSVDSCFSDKDIKKVIRAKLKPKMKRLPSNEQIDIDEGSLKELTNSKKDAAIDYTYLVHNFPLAYFAPDLCPVSGGDEKPTTANKLVSSSFSSAAVAESQFAPTVSQAENNIACKLVKFIVEGNRFPLTERTTTAATKSPRREIKGNYSVNLRENGDHFLDGSDYTSDDDTSSFSMSIQNSGLKDNVKKHEEIHPPSSRQLLTVRWVTIQILCLSK